MARLADADSLGLVRKLSAYPSVVEAGAAALEPHRITSYLQELAGLLHTYYFKHRILPPLPTDEAVEEPAFGTDAAAQCRGHRETLTPEVTAARLVLMAQVRRVLENGLALLGISAPERM
jgi:arginyl-tRNA synthetase